MHYLLKTLAFIILFTLTNESSASLYAIENKKTNPTKAIIFLHGLIGSSTTTWTNPDTNFYLPSEISKTTDNDTIVLLYEYPAACQAVTSTEASDKLASLLEQSYPSIKELSIVTHSFGGIVARRFILNTKFKINVLVNIAVPNLGSRLVNYIKYFTNICDARVLNQLVTGRGSILDDLNTQWIKNKEQIGNSKRDFEVCSAYENLPYMNYDYIVEKDSAIQFTQGFTWFDQNHIGISKPRSTNDEIYTWIESIIKSKRCLPTSQSNLAKTQASYKNNFSLWVISRNPANNGKEFVDKYGEGNASAALNLALRWKNNYFKYEALRFLYSEKNNSLEALKYFNKQKETDPKLHSILEVKLKSNIPINWQDPEPLMQINSFPK